MREKEIKLKYVQYLLLPNTDHVCSKCYRYVPFNNRYKVVNM